MPFLVINFGSKEIRQKLELLNMKADELAQALNDLGTELEKVSTEIKGKITDLEKALSNVELPAAAQQALDNLKAKAQDLDDIVPDQAPPGPVGDAGVSSTEGEETTNT